MYAGNGLELGSCCNDANGPIIQLLTSMKKT